MDISYSHSMQHTYVYAGITLLTETFIVGHSPLQLYAALYVCMNVRISYIFMKAACPMVTHIYIVCVAILTLCNLRVCNVIPCYYLQDWMGPNSGILHQCSHHSTIVG